MRRQRLSTRRLAELAKARESVDERDVGIRSDAGRRLGIDVAASAPDHDCLDFSFGACPCVSSRGAA